MGRAERLESDRRRLNRMVESSGDLMVENNRYDPSYTIPPLNVLRASRNIRIPNLVMRDRNGATEKLELTSPRQQAKREGIIYW